MSEKAVEYLSKQIENINNKLKEISDDIHCVDIEINTINDKITLIDNNTDKTEDMFISFGNEVFERNQNKLLKSKIDDLLKQKEIYQENYNQLSVKMEEMQDTIMILKPWKMWIITVIVPIYCGYWRLTEREYQGIFTIQSYRI